jgi:signal transduction histidine kinase
MTVIRAGAPENRSPMVAAGDDTQAAIVSVVSLLAATIRADEVALVEAGPAGPIPVRAGSMPADDLNWLRERHHLAARDDVSCIRFQTRPPRWASFLVLPVPGRAGAALVARRERGGPLSPENRRVAELVRECLRRVLAAEQVSDAVSASLILSEELFRTNLAAELHDDVGQRISALMIEARRLQKAAAAQGQEPLHESATWITDQLKECAEVVRDLVHETSALTLAEFGLPAAVRDLAERRQARNPLTISVACDVANSTRDLSYDELPRPTQVACLRIVQEAVTNVIKHAEARHCAITLTLEESRLLVSVEDDGIGPPAGGASGGFGLAGMRDRAAALGGSAGIGGAAGKGTVVQVELPTRARAEGD